jgi:predicted AlkP superfamily pyrophosphatase or phosphodiesterase
MSTSANAAHQSGAGAPSRKKVLLIVVDALTARLVGPAIDTGRLPNFRALAQAGTIRLDVSAIYPSITQAALSSIATGFYPRDHGVPGGYWYDVANERFAYYTGDINVILRHGLDDFLQDLVIRLNRDHLQAETVFQRVERAGLKAACINHLVYRGDVQHKVDSPWLVKLLPNITTITEMQGPSILCMGNLVETAIEALDQSLLAAAGLLNRYGIEDACSANALLVLAEGRNLPDMTIAYFMDNDDESHRVGPENALPVLERLDYRLGELFAIYGGLDKLLAEFCVLITGDHSQSNIDGDEAQAAITLEELLDGLPYAGLNRSWQGEEELILCPNMRSLQCYLRQPNGPLVDEVVTRLLADPRMDQVIWRADVANPGQPGYWVQTADRGRLRFWLAEPETPQGMDAWGGRWCWEGDLSAVDAQVDNAGRLTYGDYPNAFERLLGVLESERAGQLWATARPGSEFRFSGSQVHVGGGSHASLHALDSVIPLIVAGAPPDLSLPAHLRTVDVTPLCLSILGLTPPQPVGASHATHRRSHA